MSITYHRREPGLTGDTLQPLHREIGLERHKGEAEPQAGEQAGHQIRASLQVEADPLSHRQPLQAGGDLNDPQAELAIVDPGAGAGLARAVLTHAALIHTNPTHADGGGQRRGGEAIGQARAQGLLGGCTALQAVHLPACERFDALFFNLGLGRHSTSSGSRTSQC